MMRGMGNMQGMMKQMQKMQKDMQKEQAALHEKEFVGVATNELVKATFTGDRQLKNLDLQPDILDPEDPEMASDLIVMAVNDALAKIEVETERTMGKYAKGIPGL